MKVLQEKTKRSIVANDDMKIGDTVEIIGDVPVKIVAFEYSLVGGGVRVKVAVLDSTPSYK